MKKYIGLSLILLSATGVMHGQTAFGAYGVAQPDMKGTARYMGMAGAFGALGGDLSAITQNPGGIGVYRSSDIGFTLDLDVQNSTTEDGFGKYKMDQTKFLLNNIGAVLTLRLNSSMVPNLNFGFTYNKGASFNRVYGGDLRNLQNSMSNYIAGTSNYDGITTGDVSWEGGMNPYDPDYGFYAAPWMNILAANAGIISPQYNSATKETTWNGLWQKSMTGNSTSGYGSFVMQEKGGTNDFNIVIGGNIADKLYWGMNFDIINLNYQLDTYYGESLTNAYYLDNQGNPATGPVNWNYNGGYSLSGTGFNYQLGFIFKPIQPLRIGFAFHTPTWYSLNEEFSGYMDNGNSWYLTNDGIPGYNSYNLRTPWKIIASAAGVIGNNLIVSFDYEWANYGSMRFSEPTYYDDGYGWDYPWDWWSLTRSSGQSTRSYMNPADPYYNENLDIADYYKSSNTFRVGLEFKPIPSLSVRLGYSNVSTPVKKEVKNNENPVYPSSLSPSYRLDNATNYITCGLGYRYKHFYVDLAYVYKKMTSEYHAYTPWMPVWDGNNTNFANTLAPQSKVSLVNNQVVLSAGYRF